MTALVVPEQIAGLPLVLSVSGGKDSTAMMLAMRESGLPFRAVFADTGWEAPETYVYLNLLRERLGPIDVVKALPKVALPVLAGDTDADFRPMVDRIIDRAGFPGRMQRWCTRELKITPLRAYHDALSDDTVSVVGVRADESVSRSKMLEIEDDCEWGGWIWRPMLSWTIADVLAVHHRHDIPVNPLYQRGHERVGCYPCIFARKEEVRLIAEHAPNRIDEIRVLEEEMTELRAKRNAEVPLTRCEPCEGRGYLFHDCECCFAAGCEACDWSGRTGGAHCAACGTTGLWRKPRYNHGHAAFFQTRMTGEYDMGIDEVVKWSKTVRGGRQMPLLLDPPSGGCFRWGLCEPPGKDGE